MTNDEKYLFMGLLAICISFFEEISIQIHYPARHWWLTPVILAQEAEIRRMVV
jgi:hypothetical protein